MQCSVEGLSQSLYTDVLLENRSRSTNRTQQNRCKRRRQLTASRSQSQENASIEKAEVEHFQKDLVIPNKLVGTSPEAVSLLQNLRRIIQSLLLHLSLGSSILAHL